MARNTILLLSTFVILAAIGCGGSAITGGSGGSTSPIAPSVVPSVLGVAPSAVPVGALGTTILVYGSNLEDGATINWNGTPLITNCLAAGLVVPIPCSSAAALTAYVPASDLATAGSASITLSNPNPGGGTSNPVTFNVTAVSTGSTLVRAVPGITVPNDIAWDSTHGKLYVSAGSADPVTPNTVVAIDPFAGKINASVVAGSNPDLVSISSDASYLWVGLDGSGAVQRFLLTGLTKDISFSLPPRGSILQEAVALQAAPVNPHTVALIAGNWGYSPTGNGVYVYDDATQRPGYIPGSGFVNSYIDWMQWGADDSTLYGNQYTTIDSGGIATMNVTPAGVSLTSYAGGGLNPVLTQFDRGNGLLYSNTDAYDPVKLTQVGYFDFSDQGACTSDSVLGRYYCVSVQSIDSTDVDLYQLSVFNLSTYALIDQIYIGTSAAASPSSITGYPHKLVRWGSAGLALITNTVPYDGAGGVFLIDGPAVNPNVAPDFLSGVPVNAYANLRSMTPQATSATSGFVSVTITGSGFTPDSTACWTCSYIQFRLLPTTYISPTQLNVTIPIGSVPATVPLEISVFDSGTNLFSSNALTFTIQPASGSTQIMPLNITGLSAAWDAKSQLLYVGTAHYDGAYPNSIVALDGQTGTVVKSQIVSPDPIFLSDGAQGEYLYAAYAGSTNLTQLALPSLAITSTAVLNNPQSGPWLPGDMKAAPVSPHTTAVTLIKPGWMPQALGGVVIFDDGVERPNFAPGWSTGELYDTLAWSSSDNLLASAPNEEDGPLYQLQINSGGVSFLNQGSTVFNATGAEIHSDFGTGLIYSDDGDVADPTTGAVTGNFNASGLVAPDSTLNRVFILGQTAAQAGTTNYTIDSFNEKTFAFVSSITLNNISGSPIELVRWGASGLAVLTFGGLDYVYANGLGMTYLVQDSTFVSSAERPGPADPAIQEPVQQRWNRTSKRETLKLGQQAAHK